MEVLEHAGSRPRPGPGGLVKIHFHYSLHGFSNVYLVGNELTGDAFVVDPADFTRDVLVAVEENGWYIRAVLVTHNHEHHVRGLSTLRSIYDATVFAANASVGSQACRVVRDGERFEVCGMQAEALSVPGHSSDSIVYRVDRVLFTGDTLEAGAIGSTLSRYGGNLLRQGLAQKVLSQDESCVILPGHGPPSTVLAERRFNLGFDPALKRKETGRYDFFV